MKPVSPISAILWAALATTIPAALVQRQGEECQFYQTFSTQVRQVWINMFPNESE